MKQIQRKHWLDILMHISIWLLVYALPFMIFRNSNENNLSARMLHHAVVVASLMLVFYINYFYLIGKYLFPKRLTGFFAYNGVIILIVGILIHFWNESSLPPEISNLKKNNEFHAIGFIFRDLVSLIIVTGLSVALRMTGQWYKMENERQEEAKKRSEAELLTLRQQINPHFLFNTLNNIYALIEISPEKAQNVVLDLSKLMRYVLYENNGEKVNLNNEIKFLENYIELMRIRLSDAVDVKFENKIHENNQWLVTPMLFVSLIENAFKHGISPTHQSFIHVVFDLKGDKLVCSVQNSFFPKKNTDLTGSGIGLENLKRRLEILYPEQYEFYSGELKGIYYSRIVIPLATETT